MDSNSKTSLYAHSEIKVRLLKEYMGAYLGILSNTEWINKVYLYDLFCGPGIYENGGEGSPIIFLKEIIKADTTVARPRNKPTKFICLFNDKDREKIDLLKENISKLNLDISGSGKINFENEDYKKILKSVIQQISNFQNERGFVFIDPFGYGNISLFDIKQLALSGKSEVLLFMPTHHMYRFKDNGTPESLVKFLGDLKILNSVRGAKGLDFIEVIKNGFQQSLGDTVFVDSFVIERDKNQFFCLFFFTTNMLGYIKMLDAKWKIDKEEGRGWQNNSELTLFNSSSTSPNTFKLKNLIVKFLKEGTKTNGEILFMTIRNRFLPKHATEILKMLQNEDRITVSSNMGNKIRKGAFYLSYDHYKSEPDKVLIKLK